MCNEHDLALFHDEASFEEALHVWVRSFSDKTFKLTSLLCVAQFSLIILLLLQELRDSLVIFLFLFLLFCYDLIFVLIVIVVVAVKAVSEEH